MANYLNIPEQVVAEKWTGANYPTVFEFLDWQVWSKIDNSASGENFSIDNTPFEEGVSEGGDGILYVKIGVVMTPVPIGDYVIKENDGSLSVMAADEFDAKYKLS